MGRLNCSADSCAQAERQDVDLTCELAAPPFARPRFELLRLPGFA
jgi:hypothetical protein